MTSDATLLHRLAAVALLIALGGCASAPPVPREYLDERTAATVTVAPGALVFARDRPDLAAHARDYVTIVPIDVNRMGDHVAYLYCWVWSTIDKRGLPDGVADTRFDLVADDRVIPLTPVAGAARLAGVSEVPVRPPSSGAAALVVRTDRETLGFIAIAGTLRVVAHRGPLSARYALWSGDPATLLALR